MLDTADPCIFDNDLTRIYYSYSAVHCNVNPCSGQCVPRAFSYLHNEELQGNWLCVRNERRAATIRDVAVCVEPFAIHCRFFLRVTTYQYF